MGLFDSMKNNAKQRISDGKNDTRDNYEKASNEKLRKEAKNGTSIAAKARAQQELKRRGL